MFPIIKNLLQLNIYHHAFEVAESDHFAIIADRLKLRIELPYSLHHFVLLDVWRSLLLLVFAVVHVTGKHLDNSFVKDFAQFGNIWLGPFLMAEQLLGQVILSEGIPEVLMQDRVRITLQTIYFEILCDW